MARLGVERILEEARQHYSRAGRISAAEMKSYRDALQTPDGTSD